MESSKHRWRALRPCLSHQNATAVVSDNNGVPRNPLYRFQTPLELPNTPTEELLDPTGVN